MEKKRYFGLDAVRAVAAVFVIAAHFFLHTGYYNMPLYGGSLAVCTWLRMLFMTCTPMFMMLSGWLCIGKRWKRGYLRGLLPIVIVWLISSVLCLLQRRFWLHEAVTFGSAIYEILDFTAVSYGWYVEMYIGLYLLMPFINAAWTALEDAGRRNMMIVLLVLTVLPRITNIFHPILPNWWVGIYPIAYYVLGAWLKEYPLKLKSIWLLLGWLGVGAFAAWLRWHLADGGIFTWTIYTDRSSILVAAESVFLFSLLSRISGARYPGAVRKAVSFLAGLSLPLFLSTCLAENIFYPIYCNLLPTVRERLLFMPVIVLAVLIPSVIVAWLVNWATVRLMKLLPKQITTVRES